MLRRLPIRLRLATAYAVAMILLLAAAAGFVLVRLRLDLDDAIDATLVARADVVARLVGDRGPTAAGDMPLEDPEESVVQVADAAGRVVASVGLATGPAVPPAQLARRGAAELWTEGRVSGLEGSVRILARAGPPGFWVVVGQSRVNRDEALLDARNSFLLGGPLAVLAAAALGYWLAGRGLAPVEAMRRAAGAISTSGADQRLPLPGAPDEIRRLGETLNEMLARLHRGIERERRFLSDASHELRTPITVATVELEGALLRGDHDPDTEAALRAALEECQRMARLADDLLLLARSDEGALALLTERVVVDELLGEVRDRFAERLTAGGRSVRVRAADGVAVQADRERMRQALGNLVENALRHGEGEILLSSRCIDSRVEIDVADRGPGFDADFAERAFERFARGRPTRSTPGAGLGLAIVQTIARAHGGSAGIVGTSPAIVRICLPSSLP